MSDKLQPNLDVVRLYEDARVPPPVTKVGILPFVVGKDSHGHAEESYTTTPRSEGDEGAIPRPRRNNTLPPLYPPASGGRIGRANIHFLFMKPCAEAKHLGAPAFQIAKGTRRINVSGDWCDMREDDLIHADESFFEPLLETALREGQEEVGLKRANIRRLFDLGGFTFISASRKLVKPLHMFAAEMMDAQDFAAFETSTSEISWMSAQEFAKAGRADHVAIVQRVAERLAGVLGE